MPFDPCPKSFGPVQKYLDWHKNSFESTEGWGNGLRKCANLVEKVVFKPLNPLIDPSSFHAYSQIMN